MPRSLSDNHSHNHPRSPRGGCGQPRGAEALVLSSREGWDPRTLETASLQLLDGTLVEVGKSIETRLDLL